MKKLRHISTLPMKPPRPIFHRLLHGWVAGLLVKRCSALVKNVLGRPKKSWDVIEMMQVEERGIFVHGGKFLESADMLRRTDLKWFEVLERCEHVQLFIWRLCIECIDFLNLSQLGRFTLKKSWAITGAKRKTIQALRGDTICGKATAVISSCNLFQFISWKVHDSVPVLVPTYSWLKMV